MKSCSARSAGANAWSTTTPDNPVMRNHDPSARQQALRNHFGVLECKPIRNATSERCLSITSIPDSPTVRAALLNLSVTIGERRDQCVRKSACGRSRRRADTAKPRGISTGKALASAGFPLGLRSGWQAPARKTAPLQRGQSRNGADVRVTSRTPRRSLERGGSRRELIAAAVDESNAPCGSRQVSLPRSICAETRISSHPIDQCRSHLSG